MTADFSTRNVTVSKAVRKFFTKHISLTFVC